MLDEGGNQILFHSLKKTEHFAKCFHNGDMKNMSALGLSEGA